MQLIKRKLLNIKHKNLDKIIDIVEKILDFNKQNNGKKLKI